MQLSQDSTKQNESRFVAFERHLQTVLVTFMAGAVMFAANYFFSDTSSKATSKVQLEMLTSQVVQLRVDIKALEVSYVRRDDFSRQEDRVRQLENSVTAIKTKIGITRE